MYETFPYLQSFSSLYFNLYSDTEPSSYNPASSSSSHIIVLVSFLMFKRNINWSTFSRLIGPFTIVTNRYNETGNKPSAVASFARTRTTNFGWGSRWLGVDKKNIAGWWEDIFLISPKKQKSRVTNLRAEDLVFSRRRLVAIYPYPFTSWHSLHSRQYYHRRCRHRQYFCARRESPDSTSNSIDGASRKPREPTEIVSDKRSRKSRASREILSASFAILTGARVERKYAWTRTGSRKFHVGWPANKCL